MQNLFDVAGADGCTVTVSHGFGSAPALLWSGTLLKGQQSPVFNGYAGANEQIQAAVNSDGSVQLDWVSGTTTSDGYDLKVEPNIQVDATTAQLQSMQVNPLALAGSRGWVYKAAGTSFTNLTIAGSTLSPDPCAFSGLNPGDFVGLMLYMGAVE